MDGSQLRSAPDKKHPDWTAIIRDAGYHSFKETSPGTLLAIGYALVLVSCYGAYLLLGRIGITQSSWVKFIEVIVVLAALLYGAPYAGAVVVGLLVDPVRWTLWRRRQVHAVDILDSATSSDELVIVFHVWEDTSQGVALGAWYRHGETTNQVLGLFIDDPAGDDAPDVEKLLDALKTKAENIEKITCYVDLFQGEETAWILNTDDPALPQSLEQLRPESLGDLLALVKLAERQGPRPACSRMSALVRLLDELRNKLLSHPASHALSKEEDNAHETKSEDGLPPAAKKILQTRSAVFEFASSSWPTFTENPSEGWVYLRLFVITPALILLFVFAGIAYEDVQQTVAPRLLSTLGLPADYAHYFEGVGMAITLSGSVLSLLFGFVGIPRVLLRLLKISTRNERRFRAWTKEHLQDIAAASLPDDIDVVVMSKLDIHHSSRYGDTIYPFIGFGALPRTARQEPLFSYLASEKWFFDSHHETFPGAPLLKALRARKPEARWHLWAIAANNESIEKLGEVRLDSDGQFHPPSDWPSEQGPLIRRVLDALSTLQVVRPVQTEASPSSQQPDARVSDGQPLRMKILKLVRTPQWSSPRQSILSDESPKSRLHVAVILLFGLWLLGLVVLKALEIPSYDAFRKNHLGLLVLLWLGSFTVAVTALLFTLRAIGNRRNRQFAQRWMEDLQHRLQQHEWQGHPVLVLRSYETNDPLAFIKSKVGFGLLDSATGETVITAEDEYREESYFQPFQSQEKQQILKSLAAMVQERSAELWLAAVTDGEAQTLLSLSESPPPIQHQIERVPKDHHSSIETLISVMEKAHVVP